MNHLHTIVSDAISHLEELVEDGSWFEQIEERLHEIADSYTPIYYHDIIKIVQEDITFALSNSELWPAFNSDTPMNQIIANIYQHLYDALSSKLWELKKEKK